MSNEADPRQKLFEVAASKAAGKLLEKRDFQGLITHLLSIKSLALLREEVAGVLGSLDPEADDDADLMYLSLALKQVSETKGIERSKYYLERTLKAFGAERTNGVNDLNLNRWQLYDDVLTDSLWVMPKRDSSGSHSAGYWGNYIPQIPNQMIKRYSQKGDWVIDPFLGSGTTLIEARRLGRNSLGIELQSEVAELAASALDADGTPDGSSKTEIHVGDSRHFNLAAKLEELGAPKASLAMLHPPYYDIIKFSDDPADLSNALSEKDFLSWMGDIYKNVFEALRPGGHIVIVISDKYESGEWIPLGFRTMQKAEDLGFQLRSIVVKNFEQTTAKRGQESLWRYRALAGGFYVFKHEYIFVMQRP